MSKHNQERELFTVPEVAARWGMSPNTIHTLIKSKKLEAVPLNLTGTRPRWKVSREAMTRFLESYSNKAVESSRESSARPRKRHI